MLIHDVKYYNIQRTGDVRCEGPELHTVTPGYLPAYLLSSANNWRIIIPGKPPYNPGRYYPPASYPRDSTIRVATVQRSAAGGTTEFDIRNFFLTPTTAAQPGQKP